VRVRVVVERGNTGVEGEEPREVTHGAEVEDENTDQIGVGVG